MTYKKTDEKLIETRRSDVSRSSGILRRLVWAALAAGLAWATLSVAQESTDKKAPDEETTEALETFVPTEEVAADQAVAFPVDI